MTKWWVVRNVGSCRRPEEIPALKNHAENHPPPSPPDVFWGMDGLNNRGYIPLFCLTPFDSREEAELVLRERGYNNLLSWYDFHLVGDARDWLYWRTGATTPSSKKGLRPVLHLNRRRSLAEMRVQGFSEDGAILLEVVELSPS